MELTLVDVIGHLAFLLTAISFYLKDILLLTMARKRSNRISFK